MPSVVRYFSYGSNMSHEQIARRIGRVPPGEVARLPGHRLAFNMPMYHDPEHAYANVMPAEDLVFGVLYDCTETELTALDVVEGVGDEQYQRKRVEVQVAGRPVPAIVYVACAHRAGPNLPTTDDYLAQILAGARDHHLPEEARLEILRAAGRQDEPPMPSR